MPDIANANLSGNLTKDVELKSLPSGVDVARLRIATNTRRRSGEEWVDKTNYFNIDVYGGQARVCAEYLSKGSRVFIEAEPEWREWTDQQGNRREAVTFKGRQIIFAGGRSDTSANGHSTRAPAQPTAIAPPTAPPPPVPAPVGNGASTATADDIPF